MIIQNPLFTEEIPEKGATKGHVRFATASKKPEDVALVGFCANIAASLLFERLQAQGTNMVVTLSKDDARFDVLARYENDGVNLQWDPKPADPASLASAQEKIGNKTFMIGRRKDPEKAPAPQMPQQQAAQPINPADKEPMSDEEEDYLVKQLHRIP